MDPQSRMPELLVFVLMLGALLAGLAVLFSNPMYALAAIGLIALWVAARTVPHRTLLVWMAVCIGVGLAAAGGAWLADAQGSRVADGLWVRTSFTKSGEDAILQWPHLLTTWRVLDVDTYDQNWGTFVSNTWVSTDQRQTYLAERGDHVVALNDTGSLLFLRVGPTDVELVGTYEIPRVNGTEQAEYSSIAWDGDFITVGAYLFESESPVVRVLQLSGLAVDWVETLYLPRTPTDIEPAGAGFALAAGGLFFVNTTAGAPSVSGPVPNFDGITDLAASSDAFGASRPSDATANGFEILLASREWSISRTVPLSLGDLGRRPPVKDLEFYAGSLWVALSDAGLRRVLPDGTVAEILPGLDRSDSLDADGEKLLVLSRPNSVIVEMRGEPLLPWIPVGAGAFLALFAVTSHRAWRRRGLDLG